MEPCACYSLTVRHRHCPKTLLLASGINLQFLYRQEMQARSRLKAFQKAMNILDNIVAVIAYVVVAGLAVSELYRFVQRVVSR